MKVGIITFHYNNNFGAALQCYALQRVITEMGHEVEVIDFVPKDGERKPFWKGWNIKSGRFLKTARQRMSQLIHEPSASRAFKMFRQEHFALSERCDTLDEFRAVATQFDAVVCGSDQVWAFERPSPYFLDLGDSFRGRRISYAACCGHDRQLTDKLDEIRRLLQDFDFISVRNDFSQRIVRDLIDRSVDVVADPTLLVNFDSVMKPRSLPFSDYILIYSLSESTQEDQYRIIEATKNKVGDLPVVAIVANSCPRKSPCAQYHIYDAGPQEWVWLIANAAFVYTDSFHGALFCIKYNRPFMADYKEEWRSLRLLDVAKRYGFLNHIAGSVDDAVLNIQKIGADFNASQALADEQATGSVKFLERALCQ